MKRSFNNWSFVVCINNTEFPASLEKRKIYRALPDAFAMEKGLLRVVDESGDDYLYPDKYFLPIHLPKGEQKVIAHVR